jgi:hypothetical protein
LGGVSVTYGKNDTLVLDSAKAWLMIYHLQFYPQNISYISGLWEKVRMEFLMEKFVDCVLSIIF